jgi:hypothetical protein
MSAVDSVCGHGLSRVWLAILTDLDSDIDFNRGNDVHHGLHGTLVDRTGKSAHGKGRSEKDGGTHLESLKSWECLGQLKVKSVRIVKHSSSAYCCGLKALLPHEREAVFTLTLRTE